MAAPEKNKEDRRVTRTKRAIKQALDTLLITTPPEKLTISAIAREADIDRKTFYLHYASIDDLFHSIAIDIINTLFVNLSKRSAEAEPFKPGSIVIELDAISKNEGIRHDQLAKSLSIDFLINCLEDPVREAFLASRASFGEKIEEGSEYLLRFYLAGSLSAYIAWIKAEKPVPIETVAAAIDKAFHPHGTAI